jgi:hypothetical protein
MTLKRTVIGIGLAVIAFGIWTLARAHSQVGTCTTSTATGAAAHSGIDSTCVQTLMSYSLGFVFVASGVIITFIAFTMIAKQERIDLHAELKAVPRTWSKRNYVATSDGFDGLDGIEGLDALDSPLPIATPHYSIKSTT